MTLDVLLFLTGSALGFVAIVGAALALLATATMSTIYLETVSNLSTIVDICVKGHATMSTIYLLHFDSPIAPGRHTAQHYLGYADDLAQRIQAHLHGAGATAPREAIAWNC